MVYEQNDPNNKRRKWGRAVTFVGHYILALLKQVATGCIGRLAHSPKLQDGNPGFKKCTSA